MFTIKERQKFDIDFHRFERLFSHISRLVNISVEINNLQGETMVCIPENHAGVSCNIQEVKHGRCCAESCNLSRQIEKSGETAMQKCHDHIDILGIPLHCNQVLVGILFACSRTDKGNMSNRVIEFLEEIANRITSEIQSQFETDNLSQELSDKYEELNLIYDIGEKLKGVAIAKEAVKFIIEESRETLDSNMVLASIFGKDIHETSYSCSAPLPIDINDKSLMEKIDRALIERFDSPDIPTEHIVLNDVCDDVPLARLFDIPMGMLAVPVKLKRSVIGFVCFINFDREKSFLTGDVRLAISIAEQMSLALTNAELYQNLKDFLLSVIKTLVYSIEAKDAYTKGHSERVNIFTMKIADSMELSSEEKEAINWAAMLHDIGKIGVPGAILTKPGRLTEEEFFRVQEHPERGYMILLPIEQLKDSLNGIRYHHEKYDGTGYPLGLRGEGIPLHGRIIAIADAYDAMTSNRSYRASMSHEDAIAEIVRVKGTQLDPEIVNIFLKLFERQPSACNGQY